MKDIFNFIDMHPFISGAIAFIALFYCMFFYYTITKIDEIVQVWEEDWKEGKEDNFDELC
jgi:hypothetical protein